MRTIITTSCTKNTSNSLENKTVDNQDITNNNDDNDDINSLLFCYNCYKSGHVSKLCELPVKSFGIICFKQYKKNIKFLMVQRNFSFGFVDFLLGKYQLNDSKYLQILFNRMTLRERCLLTGNYTFKQLWAKVWGAKYKKSIQKEFCKASTKYYILRNGFVSIDDNKFYQLEKYVDSCTKNYKTPEWYFAKGKRINLNEDPRTCAIREFQEETNIGKSSYEFIKNVVFIEKHRANNNKTYEVCFFLAKHKQSNRNTFNHKYINKNNLLQMNQNKQEKQNNFLKENNEIGNMDWLTFNECLDKFRAYESEKYELLKKIREWIFSNLNLIIN